MIDICKSLMIFTCILILFWSYFRGFNFFFYSSNAFLSKSFSWERRALLSDYCFNCSLSYCNYLASWASYSFQDSNKFSRCCIKSSWAVLVLTKALKKSEIIKLFIPPIKIVKLRVKSTISWIRSSPPFITCYWSMLFAIFSVILLRTLLKTSWFWS